MNEALIDQLKRELGVSESEAADILKAIVEFIENQHPVLYGMADEILEREIEKIKIA